MRTTAEGWESYTLISIASVAETRVGSVFFFSFADVAALSQEERTQELERTNPRVCARSRRTSVWESIDIPLG